jgi:hypothetical protein
MPPWFAEFDTTAVGDPANSPPVGLGDTTAIELAAGDSADRGYIPGRCPRSGSAALWKWEARTRAVELASRAYLAYQVSERT